MVHGPGNSNPGDRRIGIHGADVGSAQRADEGPALPAGQTEMVLGDSVAPVVEDAGIDLSLSEEDHTSDLPVEEFGRFGELVNQARRARSGEIAVVGSSAAMIHLRDPREINLADEDVYDAFRAEFEKEPWSEQMNPYFEAMALAGKNGDVSFNDFETEILTAIGRGNLHPMNMAILTIANGGEPPEGAIGWSAYDSLQLLKLLASSDSTPESLYSKHVLPHAGSLFEVASKNLADRDLYDLYAHLGHLGFCRTMVDAAIDDGPLWSMDRTSQIEAQSNRQAAMTALAGCAWGAASGFQKVEGDEERSVRLATWVNVNQALFCCLSSQDSVATRRLALERLDWMTSGVSIPVEMRAAMAEPLQRSASNP